MCPHLRCIMGWGSMVIKPNKYLYSDSDTRVGRPSTAFKDNTVLLLNHSINMILAYKLQEFTVGDYGNRSGWMYHSLWKKCSDGFWYLWDSTTDTKVTEDEDGLLNIKSIAKAVRGN